MSELINTDNNRAAIRQKLLTGVSALVFSVSSAGVLAAADDRPTVWVELGGQLERVDGSQSILEPPFFANASPAILKPMVDAQILPRHAIGGEGKLIFEPRGSDWIFSAAIRYGRSNAKRHLQYATKHAVVPFTEGGTPISQQVGQVLNEFGDGQSKLNSSHTILDFQAGKDVGLGMFGSGSTSTFGLGVRFAQFSSKAQTTLHARPFYASLPAFGLPGKYSFHSRYLTNNTAVLQSSRNTHAIGPEISWDASAPIVGNAETTSVSLDWGLNAGVLFGRQRAQVHHQTSGAYFKGLLAGIYGATAKVSSYVHGPYDRERSRSVTIPNVGGFAGVSVKFANAKVSFGYRADFFFGAMDSGIDTVRKTDVGFYGPFAAVSVGLGG